jgi:hypothetical protein
MRMEQVREMAGKPCVRRMTVVVFVLVLAACGKPSAPATPREYDLWYGIYQGTAKTGYMHSQLRHVDRNGESLVELHKTMVMQGAKDSSVTQATYETTYVETPAGDFRELTRHTHTGGKLATTACRVEGNVLKIEDPVSGNKELPWTRDTGGPNTWERILATNPPALNESRRFHALEDSFLAILPQELIGRGEETFGSGENAQTLRTFEHRITLREGQTLVYRLWIDAQGDCVRSTFPAAGLEVRKLTKEAALAAGADPIDFVRDTLVRLEKPLANARKATWTKFRVQFENKDAAASFTASSSQAVTQVDSQTVEIVVRAIRPGINLTVPVHGVTFSPAVPADAASKAPNHFISAADPGVVRIAESAAVHESDHFRIAVALERRVHEHIAQFDYSKAFLTAAETAAAARGDCSEVAVLLAAVLRARGIPARVVMGLVYVDDPAALGYHMWTEAWIGDRWLPLDAVFPQGGCAADRIQVATTNLDQGLADLALLKLTQVLGARPAISVVESHTGTD